MIGRNSLAYHLGFPVAPNPGAEGGGGERTLSFLHTKSTVHHLYKHPAGKKEKKG